MLQITGQIKTTPKQNIINYLFYCEFEGTAGNKRNTPSMGFLNITDEFLQF